VTNTKRGTGRTAHGASDEARQHSSCRERPIESRLSYSLPIKRRRLSVQDEQYKKTQMRTTVSFPRNTRCARNMPARSTDRGSGGMSTLPYRFYHLCFDLHVGSKRTKSIPDTRDRRRIGTRKTHRLAMIQSGYARL